jgi:hypothetical protein
MPGTWRTAADNKRMVVSASPDDPSSSRHRVSQVMAGCKNHGPAASIMEWSKGDPAGSGEALARVTDLQVDMANEEVAQPWRIIARAPTRSSLVYQRAGSESGENPTSP